MRVPSDSTRLSLLLLLVLPVLTGVTACQSDAPRDGLPAGGGEAAASSPLARAKGRFGDAFLAARVDLAAGPDGFVTPSRALARELELTLPRTADERAAIKHKGTQAGIGVELIGATERPGQLEDGVLVFEGGAPAGGDRFVLATETGMEDFVALSAPLPGDVLSYRVSPDGVRAARQIGDTVEFLDAHGAPRVRIKAPYVIDADGARHDASLRVSDCPVDRDPRAPWGRSFEPIGEGCRVDVELGEGLRYPVLVDPFWEVTAFMNNRRTHHTSTLLPNGDVLVVGGFDENGAAVAQAELLCPEDYLCPGGVSFAATGTLGAARGAHGEGILLLGSKVLISGGRAPRSSTTALSSTELYDIAAGTFSPGPAMSAGRAHHTSTAFAANKVLLAGGEDGNGQSTAQVYDATNGLGAPINLSPGVHRRGHMAEIVPAANKVILAGGFGVLGVNQSAELFDTATSTFALIGSGQLSVPRVFGTATSLEDGRVLFVGGSNGGAVYYSTIDLYDPVANTFQQNLVQMDKGRAFHAAVKLLGEGKILITGGTDGVNVHSDAEVFDQNAGATGDFIDSLKTNMNRAHDFHTATRLLSGKALVIGGGIGALTPAQPGTGAVDLISASQAEMLARPNGDPCDDDGECINNHCYAKPGGICCNESCTDDCSSCFAAQQTDPGTFGDGFCGPVQDDTPVKQQCVSAVQLLLKCIGGEVVVEDTDITACEPYVCKGDAKTCATSCTGDEGCDPDYYCSATKCLPKHPNGETCERKEECDSAFCVDGVCCTSSCDGLCQSCVESGFVGQCTQRNGAPVEGRGTCPGAENGCDGTCATNPVACDFDQTQVCGTSTCDAGIEAGGHCDAVGNCEVSELDCGLFSCDAEGLLCLTTCETVADCKAGVGAICRPDKTCAIVQSPECDGDHTVVNPDGTVTDCSPLRCDGAACVKSCVSVDDCVEGKVCDDGGACIDPPPDPAAPEDCAMHPAPRGGLGGVGYVALLGLGLALLRKRGAK